MLPVRTNEKGEWFSGFLRESEIQVRWGDDFLTAVEKGYPEHVCERLFVIGKFVNDEVVAHTSFADMETGTLSVTTTSNRATGRRES